MTPDEAKLVAERSEALWAAGRPQQGEALVRSALVRVGADSGGVRAVLELELARYTAWTRPAEALEGLRRAREGARGSGDGALLVRVFMESARLSRRCFDVEDAREWGEAAVELARRLGEPERVAQALGELAETARVQGDHGRRVAALRARADVEREQGGDWWAWMHTRTLDRLAQALAELGDVAEEAAVVWEALGVFAGLPRDDADDRDWCVYAMVCVRAAELFGAPERSLRRAVEAWRAAIELDRLADGAHRNLAFALVRLAREHRPTDALDLLDEAHRVVRQLGENAPLDAELVELVEALEVEGFGD
mgnify:FL=1